MGNDIDYTVDTGAAGTAPCMPIGGGDKEIKVKAYIVGKDDVLPAAKLSYPAASGQRDAAAARVIELIPDYRMAIQQAVAELGPEPSPDALEAKIRETGTSVFGPRFRLVR